MKPIILAALLFALPALGAEKVLYEESFEKGTLDKLPENFMVLDGGFVVKEEGGNKFLELPGAPLDSFGLLFGPATHSGITASARVFGTGKGRRFPTFALGLNGAGGYKLQVAPGKKSLELFKGEEVVASAPFTWQSGAWTHLKLQIRTAGNSWKIEGKAWPSKTPEPAAWTVSYDEKSKPIDGRPALWGNPYSGTPIRYDDLRVVTVDSN